MAKSSPNVLFILTDQQRWDTTGVHGNPLDLTPNFDRMARGGTHLANCITPQPVCGPARACLQTGQYATRSGCYRNGIGLPPQHPMLAAQFNAAGYETGYIGKWHLAEPDVVGPVPTEQRGGYRHWLASNLLEFTSDAYQTQLYDGENRPVDLPGYRVDALTDAAIRFLDQQQTNPFFLFISYLEPHHQNHRDDYPAPTGYAERYVDRFTPPDLATLQGSAARHLPGYYGMVKRLDEALGRLLDTLQSLNLLENTIVVYTSDHGNHFKTRNDEYKRSCHDSSVRVPTAIQGPGFMSGGRRDELVSLLDLPPTLLDAAEIETPATMQGHSFLPRLHNNNAAWQEEVLIQISESEVGRAVRTQRWKFGVVAPDKDGWDDAGSETYVEHCLYDLKYDPYELDNLIAYESHRPVVDILTQRLIKRMIQAGEAPPTINSVPLVAAGQRRLLADEALE